MARDSGPPFTVTVSDNGRVVKRSTGFSDGRSSCSKPVTGSKRTIKNRLETKGNDSLDDRKHYKRKRLKEWSNQKNESVSNDACLGKGDLRYTILQKNRSRESQEKDEPTPVVDLRDKLSRKSNISPADTRSHPPETTHDTRKNMLVPSDGYNGRRQSMVEHRNSDGERQITRGLRDAYADERQSIIHEPGIAYNHGIKGMLEPRDRCDCGKHCGVDPRGSYDSGRQDGLGLVPPSRGGSNLTAVDLIRNSPSPWTLENPRLRSPDRILRSSAPTSFFPERNVDNFQNAATISPYGDVNSNLYRRNDIPSPPRAAGPGNYLMRPASHAVSSLPATRPMPSVAQYPQTSGFAHEAPYIVEQPTVMGFLLSHHLEKYAINFMAEEVDFNALRQMTDADLKELNIPMGPRKKILQALAGMAPQLRR